MCFLVHLNFAKFHLISKVIVTNKLQILFEEKEKKKKKVPWNKGLLSRSNEQQH